MIDHSMGERCSSLDSTLLDTGKFQLLKKSKHSFTWGEDPTQGGLGAYIKGYIFLAFDLLAT